MPPSGPLFSRQVYKCAMRGFFVAGTDTGVGKTEISRALCTSLRERGHQPTPLKPAETGCAPGHPEDALALQEACKTALPLDQICPYRFRLPAAPLVAAEAEGRSIDVGLLEAVAARARQPLVVEAAGGLIVPFARQAGRVLTNLDLAERFQLPVILVGRAGLGTLNHCALSAAAITARGLTLAGIVLNRVLPEDDPSVASNPFWVAELTGARVFGPTPYVPDAAARPALLKTLLSALIDTLEAHR
jgi:dethiobiotin synthetase